MIHFDAEDFSERRSEEVISFFWRSVYFGHACYPWWTKLMVIIIKAIFDIFITVRYKTNGELLF